MTRRPRVHGYAGYAGYVEGRRAERARWEALHAEQVAERQRLADDLSAAQNRLRDNWRPDKGHGKHTRATRAPGPAGQAHRGGLAASGVVNQSVPKHPVS